MIMQKNFYQKYYKKVDFYIFYGIYYFIYIIIIKMSQYQENIHIAILGPVSAGKSTLLNGLFATTYSQMKKKRTTMMPNIYQIYP